jgi:hypothetical protein
VDIGNGCGYNQTTQSYPLLYFPAPNMNVNYSSTNPADYLAILKYATCVKECPSSNKDTPVYCKQPANFNKWNPGYFKDCVYYPAGLQ